MLSSVYYSASPGVAFECFILPLTYTFSAHVTEKPGCIVLPSGDSLQLLLLPTYIY